MKMVQAHALLVATALTVTVSSVQAASERIIRRDCTADALRYCALSIPKGRAAIIKCMVSNKNSLSEQCRQHIR